MIPPPFWRFFAFGLLLSAVGLVETRAQVTPIVLSTRRDMVFDHAGNYLYVSTSDGFVRRYNLATAQFDLSYNLGGSLNGLDIAPNDSFLLVAQNAPGISQGIFHRIDTTTGGVTNIAYNRASGETGAWDVAIASNNLALVTTQFSGSGSVPLRQIDLATNVVSARADRATVDQTTAVIRGADGSRLYFLLPNSSNGPVFTYSATSNIFSPIAATNRFLGSASGAVNRTGALIATRLNTGATFDTAADFNYLHTLRAIDGGLAFDATRDRFYGVATPTAQLIAYDANTYAELYRMDIGESLSQGVTQFGSGNLVASHDGRFLALATSTGIRLFTLPAGPYPPPAPPVFGTARDMVFDNAGQRLYFSTAEGFVWPYNLTTNSFETPIDLGGSLNGMDIAADGSYLLVAQNEFGVAQGAFQKVTLATGAVTSLNYTRAFGESGAWDVAIGANGIALADTNYAGSGWVPLRQIDLATGTLTTRSDAPGSGPGGSVRQSSQIHRSADGSRMFLLEANISSGPLFTYSATSNTFGPAATTNISLSSASAAVNRNGSLVAFRPSVTGSSLDTAPNFGFVRTFSNLVSGLAFDAVADRVYGVSTYLSQIIAYDTNTFAEAFRFDVGQIVSAGGGQFTTGLLVASPDGRHLAFRASNTVTRIYDTPAVPLSRAESTIVHNGMPYAIDLPLDGPRATEPRSGGASQSFRMTFTFGQNVSSFSSAQVTGGTGAVSSSQIDPTDAHRVIVNLTGVANRQLVKVTLNNVTDVLGQHTTVSQQMGVLIGDTNGDGTVNSADVQQARNVSGQDVGAGNFRSDVNADGTLNSGDVIVVRSNSGGSVP